MNALIDDLGGLVDKKSRLNLSMKMLESLVKLVQKEALTEQYGAEAWSTCSMRFSLAQGRSLDNFEAREWVPEALRSEGSMSDDLDGLGSLWLHRNIANSICVGTGGLVYDALGRFFVGIKDRNVIVLTWPSASMLELGQTSHETLEFWENLTDAEFAEFFKIVKHCSLLEGGAVRIPYGWSCMTASLPVKSESGTLNNSVSWYLTMVHLNKKLFQQVDATSRTLISRHLCLIVMVERRMIVNLVILLVCNHYMFFNGWIVEWDPRACGVCSMSPGFLYIYIYICTCMDC